MKLRKPTTEEQEDHALSVFLPYLNETRGGQWKAEPPPPIDIDPTPKTYDRVLTNQGSGKRVALEISSFDWPPNGATIRNTLVGFAKSLEAEYRDAVSGSFTISGNINAIDESKLFAPGQRRAKHRILDDWFPNTGSKMHRGEVTQIPGLPGLTIIRQNTRGPLTVSVPLTDTNVRWPEWIGDLNDLIKTKSLKFSGVNDMRRWLLITFPGIGDKLQLIGPSLEIPPEIDELFFVDQMDRSDEWPPKNLDMVYWIVRYAIRRRNRPRDAASEETP